MFCKALLNFDLTSGHGMTQCLLFPKYFVMKNDVAVPYSWLHCCWKPDVHHKQRNVLSVFLIHCTAQTGQWVSGSSARHVFKWNCIIYVQVVSVSEMHVHKFLLWCIVCFLKSPWWRHRNAKRWYCVSAICAITRISHKLCPPKFSSKFRACNFEPY